MVPKFYPVALLSQMAGVFFSLLMATEVEPRGKEVPKSVIHMKKSSFLMHTYTNILYSRFAYSQLKHHGYIEWMGMRGCHFCGLEPEESYVSMGGALATLVLFFAMMAVSAFHGKLRRRHRCEYERTKDNYVYYNCS